MLFKIKLFVLKNSLCVIFLFDLIFQSFRSLKYQVDKNKHFQQSFFTCNRCLKDTKAAYKIYKV